MIRGHLGSGRSQVGVGVLAALLGMLSWVTCCGPASADLPSVGDTEKCYQALPAKALRPALLSEWTDTERGVWSQLCNRQPFREKDWASLHTKDGMRPDDPAYRRISGALIKAIVVSNFFDEPQFELIHVEGATIEGGLDLSHEVIRSNLALINCNFPDSEVVLNNLTSSHDLDFRGTKFQNGLRAAGMHVAGSVLLGSGKDGMPIRPRIEFNKLVDLSKSVIGGDVFITDAHAFAGIDLHSSKVSGTIDLRNSAVISEIFLTSAEAGQIELVNVSSVNLWADLVTVSGSVYLDRSNINTVRLPGAVVHGNISFRGLTTTVVDMSFAHIDRSVQFGPTTAPAQSVAGSSASPEPIPTSWKTQSILRMDHASIGVLEAPPPATAGTPGDATTPPLPDAWPTRLQLSGLTFVALRREVPLDPATLSSEFLNPESKDWTTTEMLNWLARSEPFAASVYQFASDFSTKIGLVDAASEIGYEKRNKELGIACDSSSIIECVSLGFSLLTTGYGYSMWRSLAWIVGLTITGALVFKGDGTHRLARSVTISPLTYSFDMLMPIIRLRELHYKIDLNRKWVRGYFYVQKILGFALGSFVVAGLSGLTH